MNKATNDSWNQCDGEIQELVGELQRTKRQSGLRAGLIKGAGICVLLIGCFFAVRTATQAAPRPISCMAVKSKTDQIIAGTLDAETQRRVDAHLAYCGSCRDHIQHSRITVASGEEVEFAMVAAL